MSEILNDIAAILVGNADTEGIIFARKDTVNNLLQLIYEKRISLEDIKNHIGKKYPAAGQKKLYAVSAQELLKYLNTKHWFWAN